MSWKNLPPLTPDLVIEDVLLRDTQLCTSEGCVWRLRKLGVVFFLDFVRIAGWYVIENNG